MNIIKTYFEDFWGNAKKERKKQILDLLVKNKKATLLDLGCDDGRFTKIFGEKIKTDNLYGIEVNKSAAKEAKAKKIKVRYSDLNFRFPYKDNTFDVITADQVIEHLWDLDNFVSEIYRVLKPKGYAIISTENLASWHNVFALILGLQPFTGPTVSSKNVIGFHPLTSNINEIANKYKHTLEMPSHAKVLTLTALISLFKSFNFKIERIVTAGYIPFGGKVGALLSKIDKRHSFFITTKVYKGVASFEPLK
jgi:SAM-dependent methyltransferase